MKNPFKKTPLTGPPKGGVPDGKVLYWRTEDRTVPGIGTEIREGLRNSWIRVTRAFKKTRRPKTQEELRQEAEAGKFFSYIPICPHQFRFLIASGSRTRAKVRRGYKGFRERKLTSYGSEIADTQKEHIELIQ
jgi:hypothetical protein